MKARLLSVALFFLSGCTAPRAYLYETELPVIKVGDDKADHAHVVSKERMEPIPPVKYGPWLMPSSWAVKLASLWADLPYVFAVRGPEYCAALGVDKDRMLHASAAVRFRDDSEAHTGCPALVWKDDEFMIGLGIAHSHATLDFHGERISAQDATLGSPFVVKSQSKAKIEMLRIAVHFLSGERLTGTDPFSGKEAPVPAQSLLFTRVNGAPHVFMWTPSAAETKDRISIVRVYKPAPNDDWAEVGICWVDTKEAQRAAIHRSVPPTHCNPDDLWLK